MFYDVILVFWFAITLAPYSFLSYMFPSRRRFTLKNLYIVAFMVFLHGIAFWSPTLLLYELYMSATNSTKLKFIDCNTFCVMLLSRCVCRSFRLFLEVSLT